MSNKNKLVLVIMMGIGVGIFYFSTRDLSYCVLQAKSTK